MNNRAIDLTTRGPASDLLASMVHGKVSADNFQMLLIKLEKEKVPLEARIEQRLRQLHGIAQELMTESRGRTMNTDELKDLRLTTKVGARIAKRFKKLDMFNYFSNLFKIACHNLN